MNVLRMKCLWYVLLLGLVTGLGCNRSSPPPTPLTLEELPAVMGKAFSSAKPEVKELASQILAAVQAKDYSKAFMGLQNLLGKSGLSKEQLTAASRASLTVSDLLQAAQSQGDAKAAQTIKYHLENK